MRGGGGSGRGLWVGGEGNHSPLRGLALTLKKQLAAELAARLAAQQAAAEFLLRQDVAEEKTQTRPPPILCFLHK